jgi:hypothetical protein
MKPNTDDGVGFEMEGLQVSANSPVRCGTSSAEIGSHMKIGAVESVTSLEEKVRTYEEELARLRVENDQLRRSSQAFGELAERLSVALQTATRVNRKSNSGEVGARLHALSES